jgi:hypothetical protein
VTAEEHIAAAGALLARNPTSHREAEAWERRAQAHATLALAMLTARIEASR